MIKNMNDLDSDQDEQCIEQRLIMIGDMSPPDSLRVRILNAVNMVLHDTSTCTKATKPSDIPWSFVAAAATVMLLITLWTTTNELVFLRSLNSFFAQPLSPSQRAAEAGFILEPLTHNDFAVSRESTARPSHRILTPREAYRVMNSGDFMSLSQLL
ncbi:MAG: hypothetical protein ABGW78_04335 [Pirellulales bacterium]